MNNKYGKVDKYNRIEYAPSIVSYGGKTYLNPKPEDYLLAFDGPWYPILDIPPSDPAPQGKHWIRTGFFEFNSDKKVILVKYTLIDNPQPTVEDYDKVMEEHLLNERSERGYTTREPDMYHNSQVPRWAADAKDWAAHRDEVMLYALQIMNDVAAGGTAPTIEEFKNGLPKIIWSYNENEFSNNVEELNNNENVTQEDTLNDVEEIEEPEE